MSNQSNQTRIAIVVGSTRPERLGETVARWVYERAVEGGGAEYELVDARDFDLPAVTEVPAAVETYAEPATRVWAEKVASFDGFVFVTAEYNHGVPGALKTAIDVIYKEWGHKAAGFVGYGVDGGVRAVEQLRQVMGNIRIADVSVALGLSLFTDFVDLTTFQPAARHESMLKLLLADLLPWASALRGVRATP
ncbi:NADPH-dependent FMN reductase [Tenggerimyces flavus]|uniref:NADPH-dependent FMN reductase n=1 Tax=Tenggerimyces flavus TaxID=1708749 RepID=A0ABV7YJX0_9ACTN|nr:NAD(P)H-dependent oxidoreductase [Tenggerimyces flavus]MBM7789715.1 NAD(P)H-dependent FMN reductase [Tenggerimyces flavus]